MQNLINASWFAVGMDSSRPLDALNEARDKKVIVELKNGREYTGVLKSFDIHINTVLDGAQEREDGSATRSVGRLFIRGDAVLTISPAE